MIKLSISNILLSVKMEHLSLDMEQQEQEVQWRGDKVQELEQQRV
jgi:hypothetical protein